MMKRGQLAGLAFAAPAILGLGLFVAYPLGASLYYSFCNYSVLLPPRFVGAANYAHLLGDGLFWTSLRNTAYYAALTIPGSIVVALTLAMLLNAKVRGIAVYRTLFYIPSIVPMVASSVLWIWLFNPQVGPVNSLLRLVGVDNPPGWLSDPAWAKPALVLWSIWGVGTPMVIYLAGLQDVPQELHEAAQLDGANAWGRMLHVTLPSISPHILFTAIIGIIGALQFFTPAYVVTGGSGGPVDSTMFYCLYLFQVAFADFKMGYACAMAWILFLLTVAATVAVFKSSAGRVHYAARIGGR